MSIYISPQERTREAYTDTKSITHCRGRVCVKESELHRKAISGNIHFLKRNIGFLELSGSLVFAFHMYVCADGDWTDTALLRFTRVCLCICYTVSSEMSFQSYCASRPLWDAGGQALCECRVTVWRHDESSRAFLSVRGCAVCVFRAISESIQ